jgi:hypothetical protein
MVKTEKKEKRKETIVLGWKLHNKETEIWGFWIKS